MPMALYCAGCGDIVTPRRWPNGPQWRWCECAHAGIRQAGQDVEVTALGGPFAVRVLVLSGAFLGAAVSAPPAGYGADGAWRKLHAACSADAGRGTPLYGRDCWAAVLRPGDDGADGVTFTDYCAVPESARPGFLLPELAS